MEKRVDGSDILKLSSEQCMSCVVSLLNRLVSQHEQVAGGTPSRERRNSYDEYLTDPTIVRLQSQPEFTESAGVSAAMELQRREGAVKRFKSLWLANPPQISLAAYISRFQRYCSPSPATYLSIGNIVYELVVENGVLPVTARNVFRVFVGAFMISSKAIEDNLRSMKRYAAIAGVSETDLKQLELTMLLLVDCDIEVGRDNLTLGSSDWVDSRVLLEGSRAQPSHV